MMRFLRKGWAAGLGVLMASGSASAALPAVVGTTITDLQTDALAAIDLVWPVMLAILGAFVLMKVVKRGIAKF